MKKTPIMELIDYYNQNSSLDPYVLSLMLRGQMESMLQKEKAFAFDCYEAGYSEMWEDDSRTSEENFGLFYLQYAEQHNK